MSLARDFRRIDPSSAAILLIEAGPCLLSGFPTDLQTYAEAALRRAGVTVHLNATVQSMEPGVVVANGEKIMASTIIWGAGVRAAPGASWIGAETDRNGRIKVGADLAAPGENGIYIVGDLASLKQDGQPLPALAQVAKQQGSYLGRMLRLKFERGGASGEFHYRSRGDTATIGRHAAVFVIGRVRLKGRVAWLLWAFVHIYLLIGAEKRALVATQWVWRYITNQRGARIID